MIVSDLASRLRAARAAADISQTALSEALECSPATVANWEAGRTEPVASQLQQIAELCHVSVDWLLSGGPLPHYCPPPRCDHGVPTSSRCKLCEVVA